ncbi:hypothetical protein QJ854_gp862 [Moumouvirus goulette]|uniref:Uncharacterized protein n=1 Tax=Moumouvirus goulette TaxID=1247379 RepID=M1NLR1_9VIRU|nr:hypothetical protein QJ854_gp862 [Moumouvirus goulette]AGF84920.1 hypothetical protein glt_00111 [Moumouvirus goulette]
MLYTTICGITGACIANTIARLNGADMNKDELTTGLICTVLGGFVGIGFGLCLGLVLFAKGSYFWFI